MSRYILAGVGRAEAFNPSTGDLILKSNTLTDSGIEFSITAEDIRGGRANKLLGQYFHDSAMSLTLTDALFSLEYLALNVGGTITAGGDVFESEQVVAGNEQITVTGTPVDFNGIGTIGWYSIAGKDEWTKINFTGKTAQVAGLQEGTTVCVNYVKNNDSAREFIVSSEFIPAQCYMKLTIPLFKAGTDNVTSYTASSQVGEVQIHIPNFILSGAQSLSLTASGASNTSLSGNALATFTGGEGCEGDGYYAKLVEVIMNKDEWDGVTSIVVADSDIDLAPTAEQTLEVYAMYSGGMTVPRLVDNSKLTFTADNSHATVGQHTGVVKGVNTGTTIIDCVVTGHDELIAKAVVTVG